MAVEAAANFHAAASGKPTNGATAIPVREDPATTDAMSSNGSPPGAAFSSAFQPACNRAAASTASVTPNVSSVAGITRARLRGARLALLPAFLATHTFVAGLAGTAPARAGPAFGGNDRGLLQARSGEHARLLQDRVGDRTDVRIDAPEIGNEI